MTTAAHIFPPFAGPFAGAFSGAFQEVGGFTNFDASPFGTLVLDLNSFNGITLVGSKVSQWDDQSGNANNATQGTDNVRPVFNSAGINSRPSLTFALNTSEMVVQDDNTLDLTGSVSTFAVIKPTAFIQFGSIYSKDTNANYRFIVGNDGEVFFIATGPEGTISAVSTNTVSLGQNVIFECNFPIGVGQPINFSINGAEPTSVNNTISAINTGTANMFIGTTPTAGGQDFIGEIGRILIYSNLLNTANRNSVIQGLGKQFGISVLVIP